MAKHPEMVVIGGGVIGLTTAYFLAREGVAVTLVDKGDFGQEASWAGAGILPPGNPERALTPFDQLRAYSSVLYPALSAELRELTGLDNGYLRCGGLELATEDHEPPVEGWRVEGLTFECLHHSDLRRLEPALAPELTSAYYFPDMAQVRNPRHVKALQAGCSHHGVRLRPGCPVHGWERQGDRILAVKTCEGPLAADQFILAAGAWSEPLLEQLGWRPGIHPVRGQIALVNTGGPVLSRILLEGKRYLVPRADGRVLIGSTEEDAGFDKRTTAGGINSLLSVAIALVPELVEAHLERSWAGLRPGSPDGLPFLGPVPGLTNLLVAAGHFRAGIQLSPATGLVLKELLLGRKLTIPLESFRLDRPPGPPQRVAFRS